MVTICAGAVKLRMAVDGTAEDLFAHRHCHDRDHHCLSSYG